jgi:Flp pilus assembly protein TadG
MKYFWGKYGRDSSATTAIEFALVGTIFIILLLSILEMGRFFFTWNSLQYAMEQATRYALVNEDAPISDVEQYAITQMPSVLVDPSRLSIEINYSGTSGVDFIELTGTYDYDVFSPVIPGGFFVDTDLRVNARMPVL